MDEKVVVGIDVGTTKVCTLVAQEGSSGGLHILGSGVEASQGLRKGVVVDLDASTKAISRSVDKAERQSGLEISSALVSLAGSQVKSVNNRGTVGVAGRTVDKEDVMRAVDSARAVPISHNQEVVHVIQRGFTLDGQDGIRTPVGMHAYRLEVETHIITASAASVENLRQSVQNMGVEISQFVLNPLAAAEEALTETERQMGAVICDIGGGTTDIGVYVNGDVWHTAVLALGGNHITSDIAQGLRLPMSQAEEIKLKHGRASLNGNDPNQYFHVRTIGEQEPIQVNQGDLIHIISARVEEIFSMVKQEIRRSGYEGFFPAGMVLTGGSSLLPGIREAASSVMGLPVRTAAPDNLTGKCDDLVTPAFTTSVGLLRWAYLMSEVTSQKRNGRQKSSPIGSISLDWPTVQTFLKRLLP
jgi:cell division protein FtsA